MSQLRLADEELFLQLLDLTRTGIAPLPGQSPTPLEAVFDQAMDSSDVAAYLAFLPVGVARQTPASSSVQMPTPKAAPPKGKGKSASKSKPVSVSAPPGVTSRSPDGKNVCFAYNTSQGCSQRVNAAG
eukprot:2074985-Amphidinium_carterae.1